LYKEKKQNAIGEQPCGKILHSK